MVASCKASKEAATEPAGATAAAAKSRVPLLGQAGEGNTNALVVVANVQQAARKSAPAMLAVVTRRCMVLWSGGWVGRFFGIVCVRTQISTAACWGLCLCAGLQLQYTAWHVDGQRHCLHSVSKRSSAAFRSLSVELPASQNVQAAARQIPPPFCSTRSNLTATYTHATGVRRLHKREVVASRCFHHLPVKAIRQRHPASSPPSPRSNVWPGPLLLPSICRRGRLWRPRGARVRRGPISASS